MRSRHHRSGSTKGRSDQFITKLTGGAGRLLIYLVLFSGIFGQTLAATIVGRDAVLEQSKESEYYGIVNLRPGNGATVNFNPPIFSWPYTPSPLNAAQDVAEYHFQFQASYDQSFVELVINKRTPWNVYNTIPPFDSARGNVFWRVGYINVSQNKTNAWITNSFRLFPDATTWDRSMLERDANLSQKQHPYMLFNNSNREAVYSFVRTTFPNDWKSLTDSARSATNQAWWSDPSGWGASYTAPLLTRTRLLFAALGVWALSGDPAWTNRLTQNFNNFAQWFTDARIWNLDYGDGHDRAMINTLALGYDWLHQILSPDERAIALTALRRACYRLTRNTVWKTSANDGGFPSEPPPESYTGPFYVPDFMHPKVGGSHPSATLQVSLLAGLAAFNDDPEVRLFFDQSINYLIGRTTAYGTFGGYNQGRVYAYEGVLRQTLLHNAMLFHMVFPEAHLDRIPFLRAFPDWFSRMIPPGYKQLHEAWGDVELGTARAWSLDSAGLLLAQFAKDGNAMNHYLVQQAIERNAGANPKSLVQLASLYYNPPPAPSVNNLLANVYPEDGWVIGSTHPPNTSDCFTNGVGFIFQARPRGSEMGHSHLSDLSFEIWAYGANITDAGGGINRYSKLPMAHNSLLVNGNGVFYPRQGPLRPQYCRIMAYKNSEDFVYAAGDATFGFPHESFTALGFLVSKPYGDPVVPQLHVQKVHRHMLFMRRKYFVIFDDLATTLPSTFSWLYHIAQPGLTLDSASGTFSYPSKSHYGSDITTYVAHLTDPGSLSWGNMTGAEVLKNPETGLDFSGRADAPSRSNVLWVKNKALATQFHFLTVVYPVKPGTAAPQIRRVDDFTVEVVNGAERDVISFDRNTSHPATMIIDVQGATGSAPTEPPSPVRNIRVVD